MKFAKMFIKKLRGMKTAEKENCGKKELVLLVNTDYDFLYFGDAKHKTAVYQNIYSGEIVRFKIADGTICPV